MLHRSNVFVISRQKVCLKATAPKNATFPGAIEKNARVYGPCKDISLANHHSRILLCWRRISISFFLISKEINDHRERHGEIGQ